MTNRPDRGTRNLNVPTSAITLQASTTDPLAFVLNRLLRCLRTSGSFLRDHRLVSRSAASLVIEVNAHTVEDTCVALVAAGLDLDRETHIALATLCTQYLWPPPRCSQANLEIDLEIRLQSSSNPAHAKSLAHSA